MDRRTFFNITTIAAVGALIVPASLLRSRLEVEIDYARRIIYVNDTPNRIQTKDLHDAMMSIWDDELVFPMNVLHQDRPLSRENWGFNQLYADMSYPEGMPKIDLDAVNDNPQHKSYKDTEKKLFGYDI